MKSDPFQFKLTMTNSAPSFKTKLPTVVKAQLTKELIFPLPAVIDLENNPTTVINLQLPSFISFDSLLSTFVIKPTLPSSDLGIFTIKGELSDSRLSLEFSFKVEVYNTPPKMKDKIPDFTV
jgi:hypothetical protein